jgi:hypothetical protein
LGKTLALEDLDRRVTALKAAQSARGENAIVRIEQKVDALYRVTSELIAESEQRMGAKIVEVELRLAARITNVEQHLGERIAQIGERVSAAEQRTAGLINDSEQRILVALDRPRNR